MHLPLARSGERLQDDPRGCIWHRSHPFHRHGEAGSGGSPGLPREPGARPRHRLLRHQRRSQVRCPPVRRQTGFVQPLEQAPQRLADAGFGRVRAGHAASRALVRVEGLLRRGRGEHRLRPRLCGQRRSNRRRSRRRGSVRARRRGRGLQAEHRDRGRRGRARLGRLDPSDRPRRLGLRQARPNREIHRARDRKALRRSDLRAQQARDSTPAQGSELRLRHRLGTRGNRP